jgi:hypothetical protein
MPIADEAHYISQAAMIGLEKRFVFIHDPPAFSVMISLFQRISGFNFHLSQIINLVFSLFSIILVFALIQVLFKKKYLSLLASTLFVIAKTLLKTKYYYPIEASIFFSYLFILLLVITIKKKDYLLAAGSALVLGFILQLYSFEIAISLSLFMLFFKHFKDKKFIRKALVIITLVLLVSILPFVILQKNTSEERIKEWGKWEPAYKIEPIPQNTLNPICLIHRLRCNEIGLKNIKTNYELHIYPIITVHKNAQGLWKMNAFLLEIIVFFSLLSLLFIRSWKVMLLILVTLPLIFTYILYEAAVEVDFYALTIFSLAILPLGIAGLNFLINMLNKKTKSKFKWIILIVVSLIIITNLFMILSDYTNYQPDEEKIDICAWWKSHFCFFPQETLLRNTCRQIAFNVCPDYS